MSVAYYPLIAGPSGPAIYTGNNWSYEKGMLDWTPTSPATTDNFGAGGGGPGLAAYDGTNLCFFDTFRNHILTGELINADTFTAAPGDSFTSTCRIIAQAPNFSAYGAALVQFLTSGNAVIGSSYIGSNVNGNGGIPSPPWILSSVTAVAPATTANVRIGWKAFNDNPSYIGRIHADWHTLQKN
jgi:hypothetical protein